MIAFQVLVVQGDHPPGGSRAEPWWGVGQSPTKSEGHA